MNLKVVYVLYLGKNSDNKNVYHFLISDDEDKIWGEDWNDDSVYSEQPFGTKIGDGTPFEKAVDAITKDVMKKLSESVNGGKKKVK